MRRTQETCTAKSALPPTYLRIKEIIRQKIISGELPAGARVASEKELCDTYGISRITAVRTLSDLSNDGLVIRQQGKGTFVADEITQDNRTLTIGVGLYDPAYLMMPFFSSVITGMTEVAGSSGYHVQLIVTNGRSHGDKRAFYSRVIDQKAVDGLVVVDHVVSDSDLIDLKSHGLPIVLIERSIIGYDFPSICLDNRGGAFQIIEHLLEMGHRDIGFVAVSGLDHPPARERYEGLRSALEVRGLEFHPEWVVVAQDPGSELARIIASKHRPTALMCFDDDVALRVMYALRAIGVKVPLDMSVVGFDSFPQSEHTVPRLTTVDTHLMDLGREAARTLVAEMASEKHAGRRHVISPATLVIRDSVAPPVHG